MILFTIKHILYIFIVPTRRKISKYLYSFKAIGIEFKKRTYSHRILSVYTVGTLIITYIGDILNYKLMTAMLVL